MPQAAAGGAGSGRGAALGLAFLLVVFVLMAVRFSWDRPIDDTFIHCHYARRLSETGNFEYNRGERVYGCTSPLWVIVLAAAHRAVGTPGLFDAAQALGTALAVVTVILLFGTVRLLTRNSLFGLLAAAWLVFDANYVRYSAAGMETSLATACLAGSLYALARHQTAAGPATWLAACGFGGLSVLSRPEYSVYFGLMLALTAWLCWATRGRYLSGGLWLTGAALGLGIVFAWLLFAHGQFGQWLPNTYYAKTRTVPLADSARTAAKVLTYLGYSNAMALAAIAVPVALWLRRSPPSPATGRPVAAGVSLPALWLVAALLITVAWARKGTFIWLRYTLFLTPLLILAAATLLGRAALALGWQKRLAAGFIGLQAAICHAVLVWVSTPHTIATSRMRGNILGQLAEDLDRFAPAGAQRVGLTEAGILAYHAVRPDERHVYDLVGLVSDEPLRMTREEFLKRVRPAYMVVMELAPGGWLTGAMIGDQGIPPLSALPCLARPLATYGIEVTDGAEPLRDVPLTLTAPPRYRMARRNVPPGGVAMSVYYTLYRLDWAVIGSRG